MMTAARKQILDQIVAEYAASRPDDMLAFARGSTTAILILARKPPVPEKDLRSHFLQMMFFQTATPEELAQREARYASQDGANAKKREARAAKTP